MMTRAPSRQAPHGVRAPQRPLPEESAAHPRVIRAASSSETNTYACSDSWMTSSAASDAPAPTTAVVPPPPLTQDRLARLSSMVGQALRGVWRDTKRKPGPEVVRTFGFDSDEAWVSLARLPTEECLALCEQTERIIGFDCIHMSSREAMGILATLLRVDPKVRPTLAESAAKIFASPMFSRVDAREQGAILRALADLDLRSLTELAPTWLVLHEALPRPHGLRRGIELICGHMRGVTQAQQTTHAELLKLLRTVRAHGAAKDWESAVVLALLAQSPQARLPCFLLARKLFQNGAYRVGTAGHVCARVRCRRALGGRSPLGGPASFGVCPGAATFA